MIANVYLSGRLAHRTDAALFCIFIFTPVLDQSSWPLPIPRSGDHYLELRFRVQPSSWLYRSAVVWPWGYFGIGAYAFGLVQHNLMQNVWLGLAAGILAASLAASLVALFISHKRGIYFALMTIAFGQVFWFIAVKCHFITGGEQWPPGYPAADMSGFSA